MADKEEHLAWCKKRAAAYLDRGDARQAWNSFCADMQKRDETKDHPALRDGTLLHMNGHLDTVGAVRRFIDGFN